MDNRKIAKHSRDFIGGDPSVFEYVNENADKAIDIMKCSGGFLSDYDVFVSIGLSNVDIGLSIESKKLEIEIIAVCRKNDKNWDNILAYTVFDIMDNTVLTYGSVVQNAVSAYKDTELKHALLLSPFCFSGYKPYSNSNEIVSWLMIVPISDSELKFINDNGISAFESLLDDTFDFTDLRRKTVC